MIYVKRSEVDAPPSLATVGALERTRAITWHNTAKNKGKTYSGFKAYKSHDVVDALNQMFRGKCAYCESEHTVTSPTDIEHFRPKGAIVIDGVRVKPGYYWLAADWDNLLPSCIECNRGRTQDLIAEQDADDTRELAGKANKFPLIDESRRARKPEHGDRERGQRLLLHPCRDRPERHLEFLPNGVVRARQVGGSTSRKGRMSIEVFALRRYWLTRRRHAHVLQLADQMNQVLELIEDLERDSKNQRARARMKARIASLRRATQPGAVYAGMSRQFVAAFEESMARGTSRAYVQQLLSEVTSAEARLELRPSARRPAPPRRRA
jgi:uncharacterized protein (TIGR02646 family)